MLAGFKKVCTFATAFERETHYEYDILEQMVSLNPFSAAPSILPY